MFYIVCEIEKISIHIAYFLNYFVDSKLLKEGQLLLVRAEVVLDQGLHLPLALVRLQQHFAAAP